MINGKRVIVVMPAYNVEQTLEKTYKDLDHTIVDEVLLSDNASKDKTVEMANKLGITVFRHAKNMGYGGNQKTLYRQALSRGADIIVMVHPDYQYNPKLATTMAAMIASGVYDCVLGSRVLVDSPLKGGMPVWKFVSNRFLTGFQNLLYGKRISEYHTGFRAFRREILEMLPLGTNSNDYVFDNEMLSQIIHFNFKIGEISCPAKYFAEAGSANFRQSVVYGTGCMLTAIRVFLHRHGVVRCKILDVDGQKLL